MPVLKPKTWKFLSIALPGLIVLAGTVWFVYILWFAPPCEDSCHFDYPKARQVAARAKQERFMACAQHLLDAPADDPIAVVRAAHPECADVYAKIDSMLEKKENSR